MMTQCMHFELNGKVLVMYFLITCIKLLQLSTASSTFHSVSGLEAVVNMDAYMICNDGRGEISEALIVSV